MGTCAVIGENATHPRTSGGSHLLNGRCSPCTDILNYEQQKLLIPVRNGEQFQIPPETLREVNSGSQAFPLPNEDWQGIERRASFGFAC